jgi:hypothetical protein
MFMINTANLLTAWEQGQNLSIPKRVVALLVACGWPSQDLDSLSIGQRDALLIQLRAQVFGPQAQSVADCPSCGERLELSFDLRDMLIEAPNDPSEPFELCCDEYRLLLRPANTADVLALHPRASLQQARALLLEHCVLSAQYGDQVIRPADLPAPIVEQLSASLAAADPQADLQLLLDCPECGHQWSALFDIVSFFWRELDAWARRMLRDVHTLAWAYGWREADILALSPERRALYLELVRG